MTLELKHLAPYLPYELKVMRNINGQSFIIEIKESSLFYVSIVHQDKPILHPLLDLTKEIEVDGEKFVPIDRLRKELPVLNQWRFNNETLEFYSLNYGRFYGLAVMPFMVVQRLFEMHFDVFGLIGEGLAIDKNTLK